MGKVEFPVVKRVFFRQKPPLKREDSFLKRFSSRQIPETQETVEDTGSEGVGGDSQAAPRRRRRPRKQPRTVVNPDENFYFYWLLVLTVCVLYNMWTLIVRQSFPELQTMVSNFWLSCDSLSDLVFLLDLLVQLRTGYLEQGLMVYDSKKLACHYLRSRAFLFDLAALCPLDLLQIRLGAQPLLRCPRFLKVYRAVNYYYMVESRTVWPNLWRVVNLIHILLILAHWFGCFYFLLSEAEGFQVTYSLTVSSGSRLTWPTSPGRLGLSVPSRRLRHPHQEVPRLAVLVHADPHHHRGPPHAGDECRVS